MAMSRRFFQHLAADMKNRKPGEQEYPDSNDHAVALGVWGSMVLGTSAAIQEEAPSFNRARFLDAAGFPAELLERS